MTEDEKPRTVLITSSPLHGKIAMMMIAFREISDVRDVVVISHDNSAHRLAPEEIRDAVMRLEAETFRDGYIVHKPEPRAVEGMVAALRAERFTRPLSMGYSTRRTKVRSQRCIRCNAIVPEGQRCPQCGGKRTQ